jgi:polyisoprenyl-phosphate glycosyltransferase
LTRLREQHRFVKGLFAWIGFPQKAVPYRREPRYAGQTKWNYWRLWNFALEGITACGGDASVTEWPRAASAFA